MHRSCTVVDVRRRPVDVLDLTPTLPGDVPARAVHRPLPHRPQDGHCLIAQASCGGTIELSHASAVKRTPPTSPFGSPALPTVPLLSTPTPLAHSQAPAYPRFNSFPPHSSSKHQHLSQDWISGASEESTPSITNSSSSSPSVSPSLSPAEPLSPTRLIPPGVDTDGKSDSPIHNVDYLNLVNRYCFFTGSGLDKVPEHSDLILRSYLASSIEEILSTCHSPPLGGSPHGSSSPFATPRAYRRVPATTSDDEVQRSGSATPRGPPMRRLPSTPPTPLLF